MSADADARPDAVQQEPSPWVARFAPMVPEGGTVLDVACGSGRHARMFRDRGHPVVVLDRDVVQVSDMAVDPDVEIVARDLESGRPWPLEGRTFAGVVVVNYLHRPLFPALVRSVAPGGVLIYETFAVGNERFGKPSNPDFLLHRKELLIAVRPELQVMAFEDLEEQVPRPAVRQRVVAVRAG
ncbi:methyltransferase domain-containing protein [Thalassobaculum sp. OXR-137]|uniref:class I SAM-dependent methyltransferase n=1 Tax=Thalassobaculum sp. OXR-137 TaxID=3100173 RepID=UPI002AC9DF44|nr:methyltransferase domain-containing protein [Thalassobaculum sp. OXR-137]WPZ36096.1 methyltransferase domain-containing protein [Thalassobaculum sp. OXR-137]